MRVQPKAQEMEDVMEIVLPVPLGVEIYGQDSPRQLPGNPGIAQFGIDGVRLIRNITKVKIGRASCRDRV